MPVHPAHPLGQDLKVCGCCNGFGAKVRLPDGMLEICPECEGSGIRPNGPPLVDPAAGIPLGHGVD